MLKRHPVLWFAVLTLLFSFAVYFLPLPAEQKSLLLPVLLTFVPAWCAFPSCSSPRAGRDWAACSTESTAPGSGSWSAPAWAC